MAHPFMRPHTEVGGPHSIDSGPPIFSGRPRVGARDVFVLAAWCGLLGGWLEVSTRLLCKSLIGTNRLFLMTKHFVWLVPLTNLLIFVAAGVLLAIATKLLPRPFAWLSPRFLCLFAALPSLLIAARGVYLWALFIVAWGIAIQLVGWSERFGIASRRKLFWSFLGLLALIPIVGIGTVGRDVIQQQAQAVRALPPGDSPNILLIVLDTVRADRLSVYGYPRLTTPSLELLAKRAIRFANARSTAPWTLASHASMFSGRLPSELGVEWGTALPVKFPTIAEELGNRGYATAGFAANIGYCSHDTGIDRGFARFDDYWTDLEHLRPFRTAVLFQGAWDLTLSLARWSGSPSLQPLLQYLVAPYRKDASALNREFLGWLANRQEPRRPFFAFLNYYDAHAPYVPPATAGFRFGGGPRTLGDFHVLVGQWETLDKTKLDPRYKRLISNSYDSCLHALDRELGELFETLRIQGVLENTVVIVTADHGEELGEHALYDHGESLYRPEIQVPLLVALPSQESAGVVVPEEVSLLDLAATIVDLSRTTAKSPFPGRSIAPLWRPDPSGVSPSANDRPPAISELTSPNPVNPSFGHSPARQGPLVAIAEEGYVYIRNQGDGREQLFHATTDPEEVNNLAKLDSMRARLERFRARVGELSAKRP